MVNFSWSTKSIFLTFLQKLNENVKTLQTSVVTSSLPHIYMIHTQHEREQSASVCSFIYTSSQILYARCSLVLACDELQKWFWSVTHFLCSLCHSINELFTIKWNIANELNFLFFTISYFYMNISLAFQLIFLLSMSIFFLKISLLVIWNFILYENSIELLCGLIFTECFAKTRFEAGREQHFLQTRQLWPYIVFRLRFLADSPIEWVWLKLFHFFILSSFRISDFQCLIIIHSVWHIVLRKWFYFSVRFSIFSHSLFVDFTKKHFHLRLLFNHQLWYDDLVPRFIYELNSIRYCLASFLLASQLRFGLLC